MQATQVGERAQRGVGSGGSSRMPTSRGVRPLFSPSHLLSRSGLPSPSDVVVLSILPMLDFSSLDISWGLWSSAFIRRGSQCVTVLQTGAEREKGGRGEACASDAQGVGGCGGAAGVSFSRAQRERGANDQGPAKQNALARYGARRARSSRIVPDSHSEDIFQGGVPSLAHVCAHGSLARAAEGRMGGSGSAKATRAGRPHKTRTLWRGLWRALREAVKRKGRP